MFFFRLLGKGIVSTAFLIAVVVIFVMLVNLTQPLEIILTLFLPTDFVFWGLPLLVIVFFIAPAIGFLKNGKMGKFTEKWLSRIPFLNIIFKKEKHIEIVKRGIPAVIEINIANLQLYIYGFIMGANKVVMMPEETEKTVVSMFLPSIPIPITSLLVLEVDIKNIREVEVDGERRGVASSIIQNKCLSFGQPLGGNVRFKKLNVEEIEKHLEISTKSAEN